MSNMPLNQKRTKNNSCTRCVPLFVLLTVSATTRMALKRDSLKQDKLPYLRNDLKGQVWRLLTRLNPKPPGYRDGCSISLYL